MLQHSDILLIDRKDKADPTQSPVSQSEATAFPSHPKS